MLTSLRTEFSNVSRGEMSGALAIRIEAVTAYFSGKSNRGTPIVKEVSCLQLSKKILSVFFLFKNNFLNLE